MWYIGDRAELMTDAVTRPPIDAPKTCRSQPNRKLTVETCGEIVRRRAIGR
jgi:hypothetical protein